MNEELGQRALACKGWRWMPGMLTTDGDRIIAKSKSELYGDAFLCAYMVDSRTVGGGRLSDDLLPDLDDDATLGALLGILRRAWKCHVYTFEDGDKFVAIVDGENVATFFGATEAEALVAALECAP